MMHPKPTLRESILAELDRRGMSRYRLAQEAQLNQSSLCRYLRGKGRLRVEGLERVLAVLDLVRSPS